MIKIDTHYIKCYHGLFPPCQISCSNCARPALSLVCQKQLDRDKCKIAHVRASEAFLLPSILTRYQRLCYLSPVVTTPRPCHESTLLLHPLRFLKLPPSQPLPHSRLYKGLVEVKNTPRCLESVLGPPVIAV